MSEQILEPFTPSLNDEGQKRFSYLVSNLAQAYPSFTKELVRRELDSLVCEADNLGLLKYKVP
jgi:hypothetical protein